MLTCFLFTRIVNVNCNKHLEVMFMMKILVTELPEHCSECMFCSVCEDSTLIATVDCKYLQVAEAFVKDVVESKYYVEEREDPWAQGYI